MVNLDRYTSKTEQRLPDDLLDLLSVDVAKLWDESKHPRKPNGEFGTGDETGAARHLSHEEAIDLYDRITAKALYRTMCDGFIGPPGARLKALVAQDIASRMTSSTSDLTTCAGSKTLRHAEASLEPDGTVTIRPAASSTYVTGRSTDDLQNQGIDVLTLMPRGERTNALAVTFTGDLTKEQFDQAIVSGSLRAEVPSIMLCRAELLDIPTGSTSCPYCGSADIKETLASSDELFDRTVRWVNANSMPSADTGSPEADAYLREQAVGALVSEWAAGSNASEKALEVQEGAANYFGLTSYPEATPAMAGYDETVGEAVFDQSTYDSLGEALNGEAEFGAAEHASVYNDFFGAMSALTQESFASEGLGPNDTVTLFRGTMQKLDNESNGAPADVLMRPLNSTSPDPNEAIGFAPEAVGYDYDPKFPPVKRLLEMQTPISDVLSTPATGFGCLDESEFVIVGGDRTPPTTVRHFDPYDKGLIKAKRSESKPVIVDRIAQDVDWIKAKTWDLPNVDDLPSFLEFRRLNPADTKATAPALQRATRSVAWQAAPKTLKDQVTAYLNASLTKAEWDPEKHPRGEGGKFATNGEGVQQEHHDFVAKHVVAFNKAGGEIHHFSPDKLDQWPEDEEDELPPLQMELEGLGIEAEQRTGELNTLYVSGKVTDSDEVAALERAIEGATMTERAVYGGIEDHYGVLVATGKDGMAAALSYAYTSRGDLRVGYLGSMGTVPGAATALEAQLARMARDQGVGVSSDATDDAVEYHEKIGRTVAHPDASGAPHDSNWSAQDCAALADIAHTLTVREA